MGRERVTHKSSLFVFNSLVFHNSLSIQQNIYQNDAYDAYNISYIYEEKKKMFTHLTLYQMEIVMKHRERNLWARILE